MTTDDLPRRFARNLVTARTRVDLGQMETAERAGLHLSEIGLLERGLRVPRLDTIVKLAGAVEVEACALLTGMARRSEPDQVRFCSNREGAR
jgi:transcriptional regulator with XRE-family HTH domain